jgi:stringent starvation protein B
MPTIEPPPEVSSTKPYLVRAIYEWCSDNGFTPYIAVAVSENTRVPMAHVRNGEIVLNVSALATHRLQLTNTEVSFTARFSGMAEDIRVPMTQVVAIYAKETGHGMAFDVPKPMAEPADSQPDSSPLNLVGRPSPAKPAPGRLKSQRRPSVGLAAPASADSASSPEPPEPTNPPSGPKVGGAGRPALRRVK